MIVREHVDKTKNMHPKTKQRWNEMTKKPEPLKFKLHQLDSEKAMDKEEGTASYDLFDKYKNFHVNEPLQPLEDLPFEVERTHKNNLPVYTQYKMGGQQ